MVALLMPVPVATIWLHYYCQLLWQKYGYIIIASSCDKNMVTLLLPVPVTKNMVALLLPAPATKIWLHYYCQLLWQQYACIIIASSCDRKNGCIIIASSCGNNLVA